MAGEAATWNLPIARMYEAARHNLEEAAQSRTRTEADARRWSDANMFTLADVLEDAKSKRKHGLQLVSTARKWQRGGSPSMQQLYHVLNERLSQIGGKEEELIRKVWDTVRTGNHYYKEEWGAVREITAIDVDSNDVRYKELQLGQHRQKQSRHGHDGVTFEIKTRLVCNEWYGSSGRMPLTDMQDVYFIREAVSQCNSTSGAYTYTSSSIHKVQQAKMPWWRTQDDGAESWVRSVGDALMEAGIDTVQGDVHFHRWVSRKSDGIGDRLGAGQQC